MLFYIHWMIVKKIIKKTKILSIHGKMYYKGKLNIKLKICILKLTKITKNNNPELNDLGIDDSQRFKVTPTHI